MAIETKPIYVPNGLASTNKLSPRLLVSTLQTFVDRIEKPRVLAVNDVAFSDPITNAEVRDLAIAFNQLLASLRAANIMET